MTAAEVTVLLVDDHAIVRAGFRRLLEQMPGIRVVAEAASGEEAYRVFGDCLPDVAVMDLSMAGMGGLEAIRRILARHAAARILVFSMHETPAFAQQALRAGACGYVTKTSPPEVLVEAVRAIAAGRTFLSTEMAQKLALESVGGERDPLSVLTPREFEIFRLLAAGRTADQIAEALYVSAKTVANHSTQIKQKLGIATAVDLHRVALRHGIVSE
jgi:DNA-binding NarL/FixJ family response regulator